MTAATVASGEATATRDVWGGWIGGVTDAPVRTGDWWGTVGWEGAGAGSSAGLGLSLALVSLGVARVALAAAASVSGAGVRRGPPPAPRNSFGTPAAASAAAADTPVSARLGRGIAGRSAACRRSCE